MEFSAVKTSGVAPSPRRYLKLHVTLFTIILKFVKVALSEINSECAFPID